MKGTMQVATFQLCDRETGPCIGGWPRPHAPTHGPTPQVQRKGEDGARYSYFARMPLHELLQSVQYLKHGSRVRGRRERRKTLDVPGRYAARRRFEFTNG